MDMDCTALNKFRKLPIKANPSGPIKIAIALDVKKQGYYHLSVYDALGKLISKPLKNKWLNKGAHQIKLNITSHRSNIFFVKLSDKDQVSTSKIITQFDK